MVKDFLRGKRIAITAFDLENQEHRGIASFIKSTINILSKYGAELYLITSFDCNRKSKHKNDHEFENIFVNEIYNFLSIGRGYRQLFYSNSKYKFKLLLELSFNLFKLFKYNFLLKYKFYKVNKDLKNAMLWQTFREA